MNTARLLASVVNSTITLALVLLAGRVLRAAGVDLSRSGWHQPVSVKMGAILIGTFVAIIALGLALVRIVFEIVSSLFHYELHV